MTSIGSAETAGAWDSETDVAILGFGAAGASAAIEAAVAGAPVVLLEAASGSGGTSALSGGEIYLGGTGGTRLDVHRPRHGRRRFV